MALGGGSYTTQNKELPGAYINFVSAASASAALSDRGIATMALELDWGVSGEIFEITNADFQKNSLKILGYAYDSDKLKGLRDLFIGARTLYAYRLNGGGNKADSAYATAKYAGTRGNDIKIVIQVNADNEDAFDVLTYLGTVQVDAQTVKAAEELAANDYVEFKSGATLEETAGTPLTNGTNSEVSGADHQAYLDKIEAYTYNTMGAVVTDETTKKLYVAFNKRLRDEMGIKFQTVLYNMAADYMGVINVKNKVTDDGCSEASLVYWVTGAEAGCEVNKSCQNKKYDGEFTVNVSYTQTELKAAIKAGEFVLHQVNSDVRILDDINSMVTTSDTCGDIFKDNQTIRVIDQLGNDDAVLFNTKYLGVVPNNAAGRTSLWTDLVKLRSELQDMGAIEDFSDSDVTIAQGDSKKAVVVTSEITVVNAMSKLYMTVTIA
jgi:hypothetical protein